MSPQIVVAGHVCLDIIPHLSSAAELRPGQLQSVGPAAISTGGAVANTGLALHRLGVPVALMGKVGDDLLGRAVLDVLRSHATKLADGMIVAPGAATSYSIVISPPGIDRSFLHCPGANDTFSAGDVRYDRFGDARLLHFGYPPIMRRMRIDGGEQLRIMFDRVRAAGLATSLDLCQPDPASEAGQTDWAQWLSRVLPLVDVFLPSIEELVFMLDKSSHARLAGGAGLKVVINRPFLRKLADRLIAMGTAVVVIKLGEYGLYLRTSAEAGRIETFCNRLGLDPGAWTNREVLSPCFKADHVAGTTGSGDCTIAGFLAALVRGESPAAAATSATAVGACSVEAADATGGVRPWPAVAERIAAGWPRWPVAIELGVVSSPGVDEQGTQILDGKKS